jgi:two-component system sensor histidine kinase PfeS
MSRRLFWKFILIIATGIVGMFYLISYFTLKAEQDMSLLDQKHRDELTAWGRHSESLFETGNMAALASWLEEIEQREETHAAVVQYDIQHIAGNKLNQRYYRGHHFGRGVDWQIHLYFDNTPLMEIPFQHGQGSFLILLPDRMHPGSYWPTTRLILQVFLPMTLLAILAVLLYRHIMLPLGKLERATGDFSRGDFSVRVRKMLGNRNDELSELANTFDQMASRIGELIVNQRQLIADLSHELRTPLTRLDIAVESAQRTNEQDKNLERVKRESRHIRRLVEDTLTLAWLENEQPVLNQEDLDLVDLIDVIIDDAKFEFPDCKIQTQLPNSALLKNSNHRAVGQALENITRNALRYTPAGGTVEVKLDSTDQDYQITVKDVGVGVPDELLETIFQPFFRVDKARAQGNSSFGLGLSLARRQLTAVGSSVTARNRTSGGLCMTITLPME